MAQRIDLYHIRHDAKDSTSQCVPKNFWFLHYKDQIQLHSSHDKTKIYDRISQQINHLILASPKTYLTAFPKSFEEVPVAYHICSHAFDFD